MPTRLPPTNRFGAVLDTYLEDCAMSQSEFAHNVGFDRTTVSRLRREARSPTVEELRRIAVLFADMTGKPVAAVEAELIDAVVEDAQVGVER